MTYGNHAHIDEIAGWLSLFDDLDIKCNVAGLSILRQPQPNMQLVVVPQKVGVAEVWERFKSALTPFGINALIVPDRKATPSAAHGLGLLILDDKLQPRIHSYTKWVRRHFTEREGTLSPGVFDESLKLIEALWYHIWNIRRFGAAYVQMHRLAFHDCGGSKGVAVGTHSSTMPYLAWNLASNEVSLRLS